MKLDRTLTFRRHFESQRKYLTSRLGFLKRLAGSNCGADATVVRTATLALVIPRLSTKRLFGVAVIILAINNALHVVTRSLRPTPTNKLFILAVIKPTEMRGQKTVLSLARCAQEPQHFLYERLLSSFGGQLRQLKSNTYLCLLHWNC